MGVNKSKHGASPVSQQPTILHSLRVTTSEYGGVMTLLYGQGRLSTKLGWSSPLTPIPHNSTTAVGGKGGGGSNKTQSTVNFTYTAALLMFACMGPVQGLYNVWDTKGKFALTSVTENFTVPGGGGNYTVANNPNFYDDVGVGRTDSYSFGVNDFGAGGPQTLTGNFKSRMAKVISGPAAGQYSRSGGTYTFGAADAGKVVSITYVFAIPDSTGTGLPATALNLTLFTGTQAQAPWGTPPPGNQLAYSNIAYLASAAMDVGSSGSLPNYTYEFIGKNPYGAGIGDANPSDIINDLLPSTMYGSSFPAGNIAALTNYSNYCIANGLFISPCISNQTQVSQVLRDWLDATNSDAIWSEGQLKIIPYGDTSVAGNGVLYQPNTTPVVDLNDDDFVPYGQNSNPVKISRSAAQDQKNLVQVQYSNRANSYNTDIVTEESKWHKQIHGALPEQSPRQYDFITTQPVAVFAANAILNRSVYIVKQYTFKLKWRYTFLEPMDLVTLTDAKSGLVKEPVRITKIVEDENGNMEVTAEEFPWGTATPTLYQKQVTGGFNPQFDADPGLTNTPIIFEAPPAMSQSGQHELWMAISAPSPNWGGCEIWVSVDGAEYKSIGKQYGSARAGITSGTTGVTADPYTGAFSNIDLTSSLGVLLAGTNADADSYRTLLYLGGEFISYSNLSLVSSNVYSLNPGGSGYIRRGLFGSTIAAHAASTPVARVDNAMFIWVYDPTFIGKTISIKLLSLNTTGNKKQSLANIVSPYTFIINGKFCQMEGVGKNLISNPGFENNQTGIPIGTNPSIGQRLTDGWISGASVQSSPGNFSNLIETAAPHSGTFNALIALGRNLTIAAGLATHRTIETDKIAISPGESYNYGGFLRVDATGTPFPAGVQSIVTFGLCLYTADGTFITHLSLFSGAVNSGSVVQTGGSSVTSYRLCDCYATIAPNYSGLVPAFASVMFINYCLNTNGTPFVMAASTDYCHARCDDVYLFPQWQMTGNEVGPRGNRGLTYTGGLTYSSTTTSITWTWNFTATRTDLALTPNTYNSSQAVTGLTINTSYNHFPFIDEINQVLSMVATGGTGTPAWAHTGTSVAWAAEQTRADHYPITSGPLPGATTASGTGSGGGGGIGGACLRWDVLVETKNGIMKVDHLMVGDWVRCPVAQDTPDGWALVTAVSSDVHLYEWVHVKFNVGDWLPVTAGHPFTLVDDTMKRAAQLSLEDAVPCTTGLTFPTSIEIHKYIASKVSVTIRSAAHVFYAGMKSPCISQHNLIAQS